MKVAFDVKGTLEGPMKILKLFRWFESKGCQMIVWSSVYSFAKECAEHKGLVAKVMSKCEKTPFDEGDQYAVDVAVDDEAYIERDGKISPFLSCRHMIPVHQVPSDESKFEEVFGHLFEDTPNG